MVRVHSRICASAGIERFPLSPPVLRRGEGGIFTARDCKKSRARKRECTLMGRSYLQTASDRAIIERLV